MPNSQIPKLLADVVVDHSRDALLEGSHHQTRLLSAQSKVQVGNEAMTPILRLASDVSALN
jgi:hypothetical protein